MLSNLLTASRLKTARHCKREHRIKYELGYRPLADAAELFFGSLIHLGLEAWWLAMMAGLSAEALARALAAVQAVKCDPFDLAKAEVMLMGYDAVWSADADFYEVIAVEARFETDVVNPETGASSKTWRLGGKIDVIVRDKRDGLVRILEHKTSSEDVSRGSTYWRKLKMDSQVSVYFDGAASLGFAPAACLYDVLGKPGQRPGQVALTDEHGNPIVLNAKGERVRAQGGKWRKTGDAAQGYVLQKRDETPAEYRERLVVAVTAEPSRYYSRAEVVRLEGELIDAQADIWAMGKELREAELAHRAPRNPDACERYGRMCSYFPVCSGEASLEDDRLFRKSTNIHPELAGATSSDSEQSPKEVGA